MATQSLAPAPPHNTPQIQRLRGLVSDVTRHSEETGTHLRRVCGLSVRLGRRLGLGRGELAALRYGALLHDIGKKFIADDILHKKAPLDDLEFAIMKSHCELGASHARGHGFVPEVVSIILSHHERYDGSGYPHGLRGESIPLGARIISVVDACDTIMHERAYQHARPYEEAQSELVRCAGMQFDPRLSEIYSEVLAEVAGRQGWGADEPRAGFVS
jgi:putative nucleotidyltransferase with HDIG domain